MLGDACQNICNCLSAVTPGNTPLPRPIHPQIVVTSDCEHQYRFGSQWSYGVSTYL